MSNVLIGIAGIVLFIGLALAGALFLGERFQQSQTSSKASILVQRTSQVAAAINLYNVTTGAPVQSSNIRTALFDTGYLKTFTQGMRMVASDGNTASGDAYWAVTAVGSVTTDNVENVCREVNRQTMGEPRILAEREIAGHLAGCFASENWTAFSKGTYLVFQRA
ncbi:MAG: hypothetical protein EOO77_15635 [Oxalobacteraceae bacterium]|nr:MAG: hypothetical protein EOO77_15635 [Oxalobacteraceae bacterium]